MPNIDGGTFHTVCAWHPGRVVTVDNAATTDTTNTWSTDTAAWRHRAA